VSPRLKGISPKFLTEPEKKYLEKWQYLPNLYLQMITTVWCAKEAVFKWYGSGNIDFRKHMVLNGVIAFAPDEWITIPLLFKKDTETPLKVVAKTFDGLILAYVVT
jgi:phosphopantetheinyl transferase (holo-ACP synthase)